MIFITAVDSEVTHKSALDAGCVAYPHKPFPSRLLLQLSKKSFTIWNEVRRAAEEGEP